MWKNNMQAIANIGSLTRPKYVKMPTLDLAGAIDDYYNSKDAAVARVDAEAEKQRRQAMVDEMTAQHPEAAAQIAADPMGYAKMLEERAKAERDQQFKMDMLNRQFSNSMALADRQHANSVGLAKMRDELQNQAAANAKAQRAAELEEALNSGMITKEQYNRAKQRDLLGDIVNGGKVGGGAFDSKNEFISLLGIKNTPAIWDALPEEDKKSIQARLNYMSNNPNNIYETSYQRAAGSAAAKQQATDIQNAIQSQYQQQTLSNAIDLVDSLPENLFKPYAEISSKASTYTEGRLGMTPEENEQYGYLERTIGSIENDLIAKARSKGQTGINTIAEIRQAAKGLQLGRGKQRLKGALQAMYDIERKLDSMPTVMSVMPQNNNLQVGQTIGGFKIVGVE
jgi:hypothetical protein